MALNGHELIFAHNSPTGLIRLPDLLDYVKENGGGGTGGNGLKGVSFTYEKKPTQATFLMVPKFEPEGYKPEVVAYLALGDSTVNVTADGYVIFNGAELENGKTRVFQVLTVVDGFAKLKYFSLYRSAEGLYTLYDSDVPFSGA